jgi:hypothetical protein
MWKSVFSISKVWGKLERSFAEAFPHTVISSALHFGRGCDFMR